MIAVLDYGIGNLRSAEKALQRVGGDAALTADTKAIEKADAVVLPVRLIVNVPVSPDSEASKSVAATVTVGFSGGGRSLS